VEIGCVPIVCPHCTTSYAIDPATFGAQGRTVRCSRCKETWLARPEDAVVAPAMANAGMDAAAEWEAMAAHGEENQSFQPPTVDSPSISSDWPDEDQAASAQDEDEEWPTVSPEDVRNAEAARPKRASRLGKLLKPKFLQPASFLFLRASGKPLVSLSTACAAMGALVLGLIIWRTDVVRLMPQTAAFYKLVGLEVNLRGLTFRDVKVSTETVDGKSVLVIEGAITGDARKPIELPRLRFSVRDAQGAEIYAWNAVLEQPVLKPGERAFFKSRLASPPPEGRNIDIRFFNRRDMAGGNI